MGDNNAAIGKMHRASAASAQQHGEGKKAKEKELRADKDVPLGGLHLGHPID
jgi:hypothetical protein